jgi:ATP-dependent RNA helicase RhlE
MELYAPLCRALAEEGYETPTPIQSQAIPAAMDGQDILGCAQTGTGKTAAFALPILDFIGVEKLSTKPRSPIALVLAPTRELAIQIGESFRVYGKHVRFEQALVYGGVGQAQQVNALRRGVHVLTATPGRLIDLLDQGHVNLGDIEIFVLDEADRMLDMGFMPALKRIIARLPKERQSMFFSATMPPKIRELSEQLLFNPISVNVTPKSSSVAQIEQRVYMVDRSHKLDALRDLLGSNEVGQSIVFTRTKHGANALARKLERFGFSATAIHGNKSQNARQRALEDFRKQEVTVLVATDVAARGIDIDGISHVINYDMPVEAESYVHRIGRTGRAGATGVAISFCTSEERPELKAIEQLIGKKLVVEQPTRNGTASASAANSSRPVAARETRTPRRQGTKSRPEGSPSRNQAGSTSVKVKPAKPRRKPSVWQLAPQH